MSGLSVSRRETSLDVKDASSQSSANAVRAFPDRWYLTLTLRDNDEFLGHNGDLELYLDYERIQGLIDLLVQFKKEADLLFGKVQP